MSLFRELDEKSLQELEEILVMGCSSREDEEALYLEEVARLIPSQGAEGTRFLLKLLKNQPIDPLRKTAVLAGLGNALSLLLEAGDTKMARVVFNELDKEIKKAQNLLGLGTALGALTEAGMSALNQADKAKGKAIYNTLSDWMGNTLEVDQWLQNPEPQIRVRGVEFLAAFYPPEETLPLIKAALEDHAWQVRSAAVDSLDQLKMRGPGRLEKNVELEVILNQLEERDPDQRVKEAAHGALFGYI